MTIRLAGIKLPKAVSTAKQVTAKGNVTTTRFLQRRKDSPPEQEKQDTKVLANEAVTLEPSSIGISGLSLGLTIPGPPNKYWAARVDVACYLPHGPTDNDANSALSRARDIVQDVLAEEAVEVQKFFNE